MTLARFIDEHIDAILDDWVASARAIPFARKLDSTSLRAHAAGMLAGIAGSLDRASIDQRQGPDSHGQPGAASREAGSHDARALPDGLSVNDAVAAFRVLRSSVLRRWRLLHGDSGGPGCAELIRFNEALDQALTESLAGWSNDTARRSRLLDTLLSVSPDLSFIVTLDGVLIYGNPALAQAFGQPSASLAGMPFVAGTGGADTGFLRDVRQAAQSMAPVRGELARQQEGRSLVYEYLLAPVRDEQGQVEAVAGGARDVTERKAAEEKHRRSAYYDDLTALPNRYLFGERLGQEIRRAGRTRLPLALLFIDLDGFKRVNDQLGHEAGDKLLRQSAARICQCVPGPDTVARFGGDEFAALLTDLTRLQHVDILVRHILEELARPFAIGTGEVMLSASIGIALYPRDATTADELLRHADLAMHAVKQDGRNNYAFFVPALRTAARGRMKLADELRAALPAGQLRVYYQPIVELAEGTIVGAEAQVRWQHPELGLLAAGQFFGLAEETGLAGAIDDFVLADAQARAHEWHVQRGRPLLVSVNKSRITGPGAGAGSAHWHALLAKLAQAPARVALEITEAALLDTRGMVGPLTDAGVQLCLDDFGTGHSAMGSLTTVPLTALKIDPTLVHRLDQDAVRALTAGIVVTAHGLGMKVIGESVESAGHAKQLRSIGCDYAQGFYFSQALAPARFSQLLERGA